ncbi:MAG TPA: formylglycine-generating enzyme family protein [Polyangiaceae bacterium]|jgi:formylglycine-generating enzyme required for sulfatase activity|nr:MAG: Serine/threonine-protein kinase pkn1 [Deltaproteobacteria bacterium ADurb.Bin207]HNS98228.1 formylglycine-generating enzyme family protein [Polyangiaceae bacterium]HNZ23393.1 formylglycine-generating enzyme family protein [Polyangiaceae bacterium]HOD22796.1 formylglycine-generating enzyme family protein [Polyangiaceae bacterium]HOE49847.1 formylglycine-generating enzyme family protein [Polyangiaceae bacterium]
MNYFGISLPARAFAYTGITGLLCLAAATLTNCSPDQEPAKGQLMLVVQTDMPIPKDVDSIRIEISAYGNLLFGNNYAVGPSRLLIPATLAIVAGEQETLPIHIRLTSFQESRPRTLREAVTTVPKDRIGTLRLPIQWLCDGQVKMVNGQVESTCPLGQTCVAGQCMDNKVDSSHLEAYSPRTVFGGGSGAGDGKCFDALPCFSEGAGAEVDRATCSIAEPVTGIGTNVALVMPPKSAGICGPDACLIPLDAHSATGWQSEAGRIVLPSAVCDRLENKQIVAVAVTTACETKTESIPLCGPWSSVIEKPGDFDAKGPDVEQLREDASTQDTTEPPDAEPDTDGGTTPHEVPGPSCKDMTGKECEGKDCCSTILLPGSSFPMGRSQNGNDVCPSNESCEADEQPEHTVKLSEYYLDEFEVTVGRFRRFVDQFDGTPPAKGDGAHPAIPGSGWQSGWNSNLPASKAALLTELNCDSLYQTWRDTPNGTEQLPINCVSWPVAFAFCAWDGGRLPTEAEWENAAAGGDENRLYPWGVTPPDPTLASCYCLYGKNTNCTFSDIAPTGALPKGQGRWGHKDLAGNMMEWVLDWWADNWYAEGGNTCVDCANILLGEYRVLRGGSWVQTQATYFRNASRAYDHPDTRLSSRGFRCARDKNP